MMLPRPGKWDAVDTGTPVIRRGFFSRMVCPHAHQTFYRRIDRRAGPGSFADNFAGMVCCDCGVIIKEKKIL